MLISSTLPNRANAGFAPTPERIAAIITQCILDLNPIRLKDGESFTILEPCIGRGDLVVPVAALPQTQIVGVEQDPARAAHTRTRFPQATILTADLGTVRISPGCFSLALCGGGIKSGYTHGESDDLGFKPAKDTVHVHDLQALSLIHI